MVKFDKGELDLICIPARVIELLLPLPAYYSKVYLYGLIRGEVSTDQMISDLQISRAEFAEAVEYLQKSGAIEVGQDMEIHYLTPAKKRSAPINELYQDSDYNMMIQSVFGDRILKHTEYKTIYECSEIYGLKRQVVIMLLEYCVNKYGKRVPMKFITDEALRWVQGGIDSISRAQDHIDTQRMVNEDAKMIMQQLRVRNKTLSRDFLELYEKWTKQWGLSLNVIKQAVTETNQKANSPSISYLNSVLETYYKKGFVTPVEMDEYEKKYGPLKENAKLMLQKAGISRRYSSRDTEAFERFMVKYEMPAECVLYAAECAYGYSTPIKAMEKILERWHTSGAHTLESVKKERAKFEKDKQNSPKPNQALNYPQREYTDKIETAVRDTIAEMED